MRKTAILLSALAIVISTPTCAAWSRLGHATVAQIAENHLTPKAKKALNEYLGMPLPMIASDADIYRSIWTLDLGFVPTNPNDARVSFLKDFDRSTPENISPWSHSITVDENFVSYKTDNLNGAYINNCAYYVQILADKLRNHAKDMDPDERYRAIALITHFLGDMHCPMHIVYLPRNTVKGHISVMYKGKKTLLHEFWDEGIFKAAYNFSYGDLAAAADNASRKQVKEITSGDVFDWAGRSASACWNANNSWKEGDTLPNTYAADIRPLLLSQLRDGGLRLAEVFNEIFK